MHGVMLIEGWEAEGLRCPDHLFRFTKASDAPHAVCLIQMPNGTGKTTTLEVLRAALSGAAASGAWDAAKVREFAKVQGKSRAGRFQVRLLVGSGHRLTVEMRFDFEAGTVRYATTTTGRGKDEGFKPPRDLKRFLCPEFVPFFVFDGELADRLLKKEHTDAQTAIHTLFQLQRLEDMAGAVARYWDEKTAGQQATKQKGLTQRRNKLHDLQARIAQLKLARERDKRELQTAEAELKGKGDQLQADLNKQTAIKADLDTRAAAHDVARQKVRTLAQAALRAARDPHALSSVFAQEIVGLKGSLDRAKLPGSAREFFEELALEPQCVCGQPLTDLTRQRIRERAERYLASDDVDFLNTMKSDITKLVGPEPAGPAAGLKTTLGALTSACDEESEARTDLDLVRSKGVDSDPALKQIELAIATLKEKVGGLKKQLERYDDPDEGEEDEKTNGIKVLEKREKEYEKKLAEVSNTLDLKRKRDILQPLLRGAAAKARTVLSAQVRDATNEQLNRLLPHNRIRVGEAGQHVVLAGQGSGSTGENLSVGYAFLSTLFVQSGRQLPFVVDSPVGANDHHVRGEIAAILPKLSRQVIAFVISTERSGFVDVLEAAHPGDVQHLTMFNKANRRLARDVAGRPDVNQSEDGVWTADYDYFHSFQEI